MVLVHIFELYADPMLEETIHAQIVEFLGSPPAAPVFMVLLGIGIVYSKRNTAEQLLKRGFSILILGYVLNFFRDLIPYSLLATLQSDPSYTTEAWASMWGIDILHFAGLAFIFFGIIKKFNIKDIYLPVILSVLAVANIFFRDKSTGSVVGDAVLGLFWGTDSYSWFPFCSWIAFPIAGYMFGKLLIRCKDKDKFYKISLLLSSFTLILSVVFACVNDIKFGAFELYQDTYYHQDIMGNVIFISFTIAWIAIIHFTTKRIPDRIYKMFARWSKNTNEMYCAHWILIGYLLLFLECEAQMMPVILIVFVVVFILSDIISEKVSNMRKKHNN